MDEEIKFDEEKAIAFIRSTLPAEVNEQYSDDDIIFVIDLIWEYYEQNGYLTLDADITEEESIDIDKMAVWINGEIKKDGELEMDPKDLDLIIRGELQYEESLEEFI